MKQTYFEDVEEGSPLPTVRKDPTSQQLVKYAGASGDFYQIHYDTAFAKNNGLPVIEGSEGGIKDLSEAKSICKKIGNPIINKASAGGGGKGMKVVENG